MTDFSPDRRPRLAVLDVARGVALVAMATYHFTWDLGFFGYTDPGMTAVGGWKLYARGIATSFLLLVGISLVLAHGHGVKWPKFWRRWAGIAAAAVAITVATLWFSPQSFIFFGILHEIALASLLGLPFLRISPLVTVLVAVAIVAMPHFARSALFDSWPFWWVGLSTVPLRSNDYVPVFPWLAPVLFGIAGARWAERSGLFHRLARFQPGAWSRPLRYIGRHSLLFYLVHQPVLIACVWAFSQVSPPSPERLYSGFRKACETNCVGQNYDAGFCAAYCTCLLDGLQAAGHLNGHYPSSNREREEMDQSKAMCFGKAQGIPADQEDAQ